MRLLPVCFCCISHNCSFSFYVKELLPIQGRRGVETCIDIVDLEKVLQSPKRVD